MSTRLTDAQRRDRDMTEAQLQLAVTNLAEIFGWSWVHFRPAETKHGWRVPVEGPLGKGWPDLVLLHVKRRRLVFAELKRETGQVDADQAAVLAALDVLGHCMCGGAECIGLANANPRVEVHVWRPSDLGDPVQAGAIARVLGGGER